MAAPIQDEFRRRRINAARPSVDASQRDALLGRLQHLRTIVPVFAQELASARRQAAALRQENRKLLERIQELQRDRPGVPDRSPENPRGAQDKCLPTSSS
jgi:hypothetical protein